MKINKQSIFKGFKSLRRPLVAIILGLLIGALVIVASGEDPLEVYRKMFENSFFKSYYLLSAFTRATPIMICAYATSISWRAGYYNIGIEGEMIVGTVVSVVLALTIPGPGWLVFIVSWLGGMLAGALYAIVPAFLQMKFGASLTIISLMMNYIAKYITSYFVTYHLKDSSSSDIAAIQTPLLDEGVRLPKLMAQGTFNMGFIIAIIIMLLLIFYTKKTVLGYESKMTGLNPNFASYGGINQKKTMLITMALTGAVASIAGACIVFGVDYRYLDGMLTSGSYAWTGLMAALIANHNPVGIFASSIFLSGLQIGGSAIQRTMKMPVELATIIQCCITLFVAVKLDFALKNRKLKLSKKENKDLKEEK
ncbi:ABC transporter permease [Peptoniphilaceae bacterium SGI.131]